MIHCQACVATDNADIVPHYQSMVLIACFLTAFSGSVSHQLGLSPAGAPSIAGKQAGDEQAW